MRNTQPLPRKPESYTRKQGHFVGFDGFIVPNTFGEYYARYPDYVQQWVTRNVHSPIVKTREDVLDFATDLHMFLMTLPPKSTKRTRKIKDVIAAFHPAKCEGASKVKFFRFLDFTLWNRYTSIWRKQSKDALQQQHLEQFLDDDAPVTDGQDLHALIYLDEFRSFCGAEPNVLQLIEALLICGSMRAAKASIGWTTLCHRGAGERLAILADYFARGLPVPAQV